MSEQPALSLDPADCEFSIRQLAKVKFLAASLKYAVPGSENKELCEAICRYCEAIKSCIDPTAQKPTARPSDPDLSLFGSK
jgi:hypothetical protein